MTKIICKACSNGCDLYITRKDSETLLVNGNRCTKGVGYAFKELKDKLKGRFLPANKSQYKDKYLSEVLKTWSIQIKKSMPGMFISGSPERSLFRIVIEDNQGEKYILEEIDSHKVVMKNEIAERIDILSDSGLPVINYLKNYKNDHISEYDSKWWQLIPFKKGEELDRNSYWKDGWRGRELAIFLHSLYRNHEKICFDSNKVFSIPDYIEEQYAEIQIRIPELAKDLKYIVEYLRDKFFPLYHTFPVVFSHGDPHPLNMLWSEDKIIAALDWEFSGLKPVMYDSALIIGCVGSEDPDARHSNFVKAFLDQINKDKLINPELMVHLPVFVLASRFAWLSEWLRRGDEEMISFEVYYMGILFDELAI